MTTVVDATGAGEAAFGACGSGVEECVRQSESCGGAFSLSVLALEGRQGDPASKTYSQATKVCSVKRARCVRKWRLVKG
jgi:hypothetical protein